ncbi:MAG: Stp1/IreP family PP2C-type Ser/Thr phosphatase [Solirubrobacterales bacterium]
MLRVIDFASASDVGRVRKANEDAYFVRSPLFVVADGMGGAQAGEVASQIASDAFSGELDESIAPEPRMANVVRRANEEIHVKSLSDPNMQGMGTTLTAALLGDGELTIAHVGDSRAYRLREGELTRLTRDHSLVGEMVRRGAITEEEAEHHPQRSILTRALGPEPEVEVDTLSHSVKDGDVFMLCSDGLTGMVSEADIAEVLGSGKAMRECAEELIRRANGNGGVDNITVVAFKVAGSGTKSEAPVEPAPGQETIVGAPAVVPPPAEQASRAPQTAAAGGNGHVPPSAHSAEAADARRAETKRSRRWVGGIVIALVIIVGIGGAVIGSLNVYFLGTNQQGLVTVYRGVPYDLGLSLYTRDYVTTVPAESLTPQQRAVLLDHKLRTRSDALDLAGQIERGELKAATSPDRGSASGSSDGATAP